MMRAAEGERFATYVHARVGKSTQAQMGKFGAVLRYKTDGSDEVLWGKTLSQCGVMLPAHVVA